MLTTKADGLDKLEKRRDEVRRSKHFKIVMTIGAVLVATVMLAIFVVGKLTEAR
jgi:hypothetical protein